MFIAGGDEKLAGRWNARPAQRGPAHTVLGKNKTLLIGLAESSVLPPFQVGFTAVCC
jgi:hypothetical protein